MIGRYSLDLSSAEHESHSNHILATYICCTASTDVKKHRMAFHKIAFSMTMIACLHGSVYTMKIYKVLIWAENVNTYRFVHVFIYLKLALVYTHTQWCVCKRVCVRVLWDYISNINNQKGKLNFHVGQIYLLHISSMTSKTRKYIWLKWKCVSS